jgi:hypothetical protein
MPDRHSNPSSPRTRLDLDLESAVPAPLMQAAAAVAALLARTGRATDEALAAPLQSRAALERTAAALEESARLTSGIEPCVRVLLDSLADGLTAQRDRSEALRARAEELTARRLSYEELLERYSALGRAAEEVHRLLHAFVATGDARALPTTSLAEVEDAVSRLAGGAARAGEAAREREFDDLAREADVLREQLEEARHRLRAAAERYAAVPLQ